jgi:hypothetical protein
MNLLAASPIQTAPGINGFFASPLSSKRNIEEMIQREREKLIAKTEKQK